MTGGDVTKLPKWAQQRIALAERDRDHFRAMLRGPEDGTATAFLDPYSDTPRPLGEDVSIRFTVGTRPDGRPYEIDVRHRGDRLEVMAVDEGIAIVPQSSNVVIVRAFKW